MREDTGNSTGSKAGMTDRNKLLALAEEAEKLTGPDRETMHAAFDACMSRTVPSGPGMVTWTREWLRFQRLVNAEAWLDAAMSLVPTKPFPELRPGKWWWSVDNLGCDAHVAYENHDAGIPEYSACAATPALALCAAALRAQAEALS